MFYGYIRDCPVYVAWFHLASANMKVTYSHLKIILNNTLLEYNYDT